MANSFNVPESPTTFSHSITNFLGVDYNDPIYSDARHSPNMKNMILENNYLKKRYGLKIKMHVDNAPIYGIWNYDVPSDDDFSEVIIAHCGNKLYEITPDFSLKTVVMTGLAENDSFGMFLGDKLVILDGKRAIVYGKYNNSYGAQFMDMVAYIPTTTIGLTPNGLNGTHYEDVNLMTQFRINEFLSDGSSKEYHTDSHSISTNSADTSVWILNNETGLWDLQDQTSYSINSDGIIIFNEPPVKGAMTGRDNVRISFKSTTEDHANLINKCRFCTTFGYQGNNQRLFYSGNSEQPNVDWHSDLVAAQPDPTYIPDTSFAVIGSQPIKGYLRLSDGTLAILKGLSDTDCSIYYRTSNANGIYDVFPLLSGTKNVGCLNIYTCCNVQNAAMFLGELGVYQATVGVASSTAERYADNKSYYINKKLLKEDCLYNAKALSIGGYYYLFINNKIYVCDTTKQTLPKNGSIYQYQWFPFESSTLVQSVMRWNNQVVIGDTLGNIKMFGNDYIDDIDTTHSEEVECYYESMPIDFSTSAYNRSNKAKTTRNFTLNYIASENTYFDFGYKTIDDEAVSETIYKLTDGNLPTDANEEVDLPYGTKLNITVNNKFEFTDGIYGWFYGTQTDKLKTIFGFYTENNNTKLGVFTIDNSGNIKFIKTLYNKELLINTLIIKKILHGSASQVASTVNIPLSNITQFTRDNITISNPTLNDIPQTITIKEKARKIMFIKFYVESKKLACEFDRVFIDFRNAGKYRGE